MTRLRPTALATAVQALLATLVAVPAVWAQEATQRIEITGSSIKRIDAETALPVQVITRQDIQKSGATNIEQLMLTIGANTSSGALMSNGASGATTGSISSVSLRGLTSIRTLVLINGRRVAPYGIGFTGDSVSVDVGSIPITMVDRVEVLKDGASAIYGSDAVAGVVNFILRRDYTGGELQVDAGDTQHGGAGSRRAGLTFGFGDGSRYNVTLSGSFQNDASLLGRQRKFASVGYSLPDGNDPTSFHTYPANVLDVATTATYGGNPSAPQCQAPFAINRGPVDDPFCVFDPSPLVTLLPKTERASFMATGKWSLSDALEAFFEASFTKTKTRTVIQPVPFSFLFALPANNPLNSQAPWDGNYPAGYGALSGTPHGLGNAVSTILLKPGTPFYPTAFIQSQLADPNDPLPPLTVFYRSHETGNRDTTDIAEAPRFVAGMRGLAAGWDWEAALLRSQSKVRQQVDDGFPANSLILPLLNSGRVNFFAPNTPAIVAELRATNFTGDAFTIDSKITSVTARASRDLMKLGGGNAGLALGTELRKEQYLFDANPTIQTGDISGYGGNFLNTERSRRVDALFAELNLPLMKGLEVNGAVRWDRYEGVGNSTTPKISLRWQPLPQVLLRAAAGKGFRAPSLQDLYLPNTTGVTTPGLSDPLRCPTTGSRTDCSTQFAIVNGGNPGLTPEKSTNKTLGLVLSPIPQLTVALDAFAIALTDTISNGVAPPVIFADLARYGGLIRRGPVDVAYPNLPGPIIQIDQTNINQGETKVAGVDLDVKFIQPLAGGRITASLAGTYFSKYDTQNPDGTFSGGLDTTNTATGGIVPRWKHYASIDYATGPWGFTLGQSWQKSYNDLPGTNAGAPARRVGAYELYDIQARYSGFKGLELRAGIRNLLDRDPPYSNAGGQTSFQGGYDPGYADPRGRYYYAGLTYKFY
jgi:iron complex outermembrane receptor protein